MDNGRKAFVKTDGRSSDQAAIRTDESRKKLAHESENIVIALPCKICEELCPSDKLIDRLQYRKERKMPNEASWKILHFKHKNLRLMNAAAPAIRYQFMELRNRSSARVQSNYWTWNDSNTNDSAGDPFERPASEAIFPRREERVGKLSLKLSERYALQ